MVSAVGGLELGKITRTERINDTGIFPTGGNPRCWIYSSYGYGHGLLNVSDAIKHSCNYFFYEVGTRLGIDNIEKYARNFGLGEKTNVELPEEISGTLAARKEGETWYPGNTLNAAIGQGDNSFTPIQMAKYIAVLANGGKDIDVTLIRQVIDLNKNQVDLDEIKEYTNERLGIKETASEKMELNQENVNVVLEGMKSVTTETGGTAYSTFRDFDIEVGGKTGSAEATGNKVNAWFAGFAPYDDPEIAIVVLVENGGHGYYTAEVTKEIIASYFGLNQSIQENRTALPYN
jgi:penicillin-binding protein 2